MWNVIILGITSLLTDVSTEMVYPLLPLFLTTRMGASPAIVGLIEGAAESTASLMKVASGRRSDRTGRRKPLAIAGYAGSTVGKLLFVLANGWGLVLLGRLADRFGKGIRTAPRDALIADSTVEGRRGRAYGLHRFMDTLGSLAGVLIAYAFIAHGRSDYNTIFLLSLIPAGLGVGALFLVREQRDASSRPSRSRREERVAPPTSGDGFWRGRLHAFRALDPRLRGFLLVALLFTLGNSSNQFLLLRASDLGYGDSTVLLLYALYTAVYALLSYPAGRLSDTLGRRGLLVAGYICYGLVYLGFALTGPSGLVPLFAAYGAYIALTEGVEKALVADLAPVHLRATLIGLHATVVGIGLLPASLLAGALWDTVGPAAPFAFGGAMGLAAAVGLARVLRDR